MVHSEHASHSQKANLERASFVPGANVASRKRIRVLKVSDRNDWMDQPEPQCVGTGSECELAALPHPVGNDDPSSIIILVRKGNGFLDTPVFLTDATGSDCTVAFFISRQHAQQYLDQTGWGLTDEVGVIKPDDLLDWLEDADWEGVRHMTMYSDRERHLASDPQLVLSLDLLCEETADSLLQQLTTLATG